MLNIIKSLQKYIYDCTGIQINCKSKKPSSLPYFILNEYNFYKARIHNKDMILLVPKSGGEIPPLTIKRHIKIVQQKLKQDAVFVCSFITSYNRKRLIENKLPFIVPNNQMYLPDLMIDLREHFLSTRSKKDYFSPSTQAVFLYILHHFREHPFTPTDLAKKLDYSNMTMTRSFDELESANLGQINFEGRERWLLVQNNRLQFWETALNYLKTPVKKKLWVRSVPEELKKFKAGLTALSRYSMINPTKYTTFATTKKDWENCYSNNNIKVVKFEEEAKSELQIWKYPPELFANGDTVDKFSLYLSLKDNDDERIQIALKEMMESIKW